MTNTVNDAKNAIKNGDYNDAIRIYDQVLKNIDYTRYLLIDANPHEFSRELYLESFFNMGTLLKMHFEQTLDISSFNQSKYYFLMILKIDPEHTNSILQLVSLYTRVCGINCTTNKTCIEYLEDILTIAPEFPIVHYNLGHVYKCDNNIIKSIIHYKLAVALIGNKTSIEDLQLKVNSLNGLANIYRNVKNWSNSLYYLKKCLEIYPNDPDINNQLGIVYTELRRTDLAHAVYKIAIDNVKNTFISISSNPDTLLADIYLNYGYLYSYNGDNTKSIECYNKSISILPKFRLPFQNKLMNLNYLVDEIKDELYIKTQHMHINKIIDKRIKSNKFPVRTRNSIINIGLVSGDFVDHPVSFFINTFINGYDRNIFKVTCYTETVITISKSKDVDFKLVKGMSAIDAAGLIYNDHIDILFDLSGHTGCNRLDIFALKPAPIQISYIGYPCTTGLNEMDYRITDSYCDDDNSQKYYTEKLLYMQNCFLCYYIPDDLPTITTREHDSFIRIGCFNRLNKINNNVIKCVSTILSNCPRVIFVFKTKALLNKEISKEFLGKFDKCVLDRINILECDLLHSDHLLQYNNLDFTLDTFPYSGTTTSCESLLMGVPVFSKRGIHHVENVTCSILSNSPGLEKYICTDTADIITKINSTSTLGRELKEHTRMSFINGLVCNQKLYLENFQEIIVGLFK